MENNAALEAIFDPETLQGMRVRSMRGRAVLSLALRWPRATTGLLIKVIGPENLMRFWNDEHVDPNVDIGYIKTVGLTARAPPFLQLAI